MEPSIRSPSSVVEVESRLSKNFFIQNDVARSPRSRTPLRSFRAGPPAKTTVPFQGSKPASSQKMSATASHRKLHLPGAPLILSSDPPSSSSHALDEVLKLAEELDATEATQSSHSSATNSYRSLVNVSNASPQRNAGVASTPQSPSWRDRCRKKGVSSSLKMDRPLADFENGRIFEDQLYSLLSPSSAHSKASASLAVPEVVEIVEQTEAPRSPTRSPMKKKRRTVRRKITKSLAKGATTSDKEPKSPKRKSRKKSLKISHPIPVPVLPVFDDTRDEDARRVAELEARLQDIETSRTKDLKKIEKSMVRKMEAIHAHAWVKAEQESESSERILRENDKIAKALRKENKRIREQIHECSKDVQRLRINGERLERAKIAIRDQLPALQRFHRQCSEGNQTLQKTLGDLIRETAEVQEKLSDAIFGYQTDRSSRANYEKVINAAKERVSEIHDDELFDDVQNRIDLLRSHTRKTSPLKYGYQPPMSPRPSKWDSKRSLFKKAASDRWGP